MGFKKIAQLMNILMSLFYIQKILILKMRNKKIKFDKFKNPMVLKDILALVVIFFSGTPKRQL